MSDADEERLRYLAELDLFPGTRLQVLEHEPFEGSIRIWVDGEERSLSPSLAEIVKVEPDASEGGS